jgi:hemerythrin superfamily protein
MDAISLLKSDHKTVESLFKKFESAGPRATKTKQQAVEKIVRELSIHAAIEEQIFYPKVRESVPDAEELVLESLEEHHVVKWTLSELHGMSPEDERFTPKTRVLIESVRHHVREEEGELFPKVRSALSRNELQELGEQMADAKRFVPERPHPRAPDTPPGNLGAALVASPLDKVRRSGREAVRKLVGVIHTP